MVAATVCTIVVVSIFSDSGFLVVVVVVVVVDVVVVVVVVVLVVVFVQGSVTRSIVLPILLYGFPHSVCLKIFNLIKINPD